MKATTLIIPIYGDSILLDELYTPCGAVFIGKDKYTQYRIEDDILPTNFIDRIIYLEK